MMYCRAIQPATNMSMNVAKLIPTSREAKTFIVASYESARASRTKSPLFSQQIECRAPRVFPSPWSRGRDSI